MEEKMARIETWYKQDLKRPVKVQTLMGNVFTLDNVGSLIGVEVFSDGVEETLTGAANGYCILPDGTTISVPGTRSGNKAYILLPQSVLAYPGLLKITVKLTNGNEITTLLAVIATVARSRTDAIITPSQQIITDWSQQIAAEMQAVEDASAAQDAKISDLKSAIDKSVTIDYTTVDGYLLSNGNVNASDAYIEATTDFLPINKGMKITFMADWRGYSKPQWNAYCLYNSKKKLLTTPGRVVFEDITASKIIYTIEITQEAAAYIRICWRVQTTGVDVTLICSNKTYDLERNKAEQDAVNRNIFGYENYSNEMLNGNGFLAPNLFVIGTTNSTGTGNPITYDGTSRNRVCINDLNGIVMPIRTKITAETGYRFYITYLNDSGNVTGTSGWVSNITLAKSARVSILMGEDPEDDTMVLGSAWDMVKHFTANTFMTELVGKVESNTSIANNPLGSFMYWDHTFIDKISSSGYQTQVIPNQSLANVETSRRLGFKMIEVNPKKTSGNDYITLHGSNGKFGYEVYSLDETDITNVYVDQKTLAWIRENVRYHSTIDKYKVCPPTLQEFLYACKQNNIYPLVNVIDAGVMAICDEICGRNNYIAYFSNTYGQHRIVDGQIMTHYKSLETKAEILEWCDKFGVPYIYAMANTTDFTDLQLSEIVNELHAKGYLITYAASYVSPVEDQRLKRLGFDGAAYSYCVPDFDSGNVAHLCGDATYDGFTTDGTISDGTITLSENDTITPSNEISSKFLSKGVLHVTFNGNIKVVMGDWLSSIYGYSTNGEIMTMHFSTYFLQSAPTFRIVGGSSGAVIYSLQFDASEV